MRLLLVVLFLPAAGTWGYLWTLSSRDRADFAGCAWARKWGNSAQEEIGWWPRSSMASIRLASRSELFGCSFDGFGVLFLPAARNGAVQYWSRQKRSVIDGIAYAWYLNVGQTWFKPAGTDGRVTTRVAIRLASREGLFVVMVIVSVLLFLPAASHCWSSSSSSPHPTGFSRAYAVYFWGISLNTGTGAMDRVMRLGVRLASRECCLV